MAILNSAPHRETRSQMTTTTEAAPVDRPRAAELVPFADLVGRQEIAERLGITVAAIDTWRRRYPSFPDPLIVLSSTPIWRWSIVAAWAHATPRRPGRPRKGTHD
jgi:hypothetical protein